ncbi:hypothetical protein [Puia sp.]|jgi:integrase|uniref:hypothetical protein n=1 Tax=Puia sp. TaxID=2045100 RepID=UPI002F42F372
MKRSRKQNPRILLPGGCSASTPSVHPANWKTVAASCARPWYIHYRFYDPTNGSRQIIAKGMNDYKTARERRAATERLLSDELGRLTQGFNPITEGWAASSVAGLIDKHTPILVALEAAQKSVKCSQYALRDIRGMLHWIPLAVTALSWQSLPVSEIKTSHIRVLLDQCAQISTRTDAETGRLVKAKWSDHKFNKYRSYLMILFSEIIELGGLEMNPCRELRKRKATKRVRETLSMPQRATINRYLKRLNYGFWRFLHIFFHSGARESEILMVQRKHVDLENQKFVRLVKKDRSYREVSTTIKNVALPLWKEAILKYDRKTGSVIECDPEDFIFSKGFVPGKRSIRPDWISEVWLRLVKGNLGYTADFYSLKHSNTTETRKLAGEEVAAEQNAHRSTAMVREIYDVDRAGWMHEQMKRVNNPFA